MRYKILIWGTGNYSKIFIENGFNAELVGFIQTEKTQPSFRGMPIYTPSELPNSFDYIIVANSYSYEVYNTCGQLGIPLDKVIFLYKCFTKYGFTDVEKISEIIGDRNYVRYCNEYKLFEDSFVYEDALQYEKTNKRINFSIDYSNLWPIIDDKYALAGTVHNYFWQDLWAAKKIINAGVKRHLDIGSRLDGFIAHLLSAGIDVTMIDVREFPEPIEGLSTIVDDATTLHQIEDESIESLSALCSLEHFGLGRYGDSIDPEACFKCFSNIEKKLCFGGDLYIAVPIGKERIEFNAHRIFYPQTIIENFSGLRLIEFSCVAEGKIEKNVDIHKYDNDCHNGEYRYGLFHFGKY